VAIYNPEAPQILGQEWVPIRNQDITLGVQEAATEWGVSVPLQPVTTLASARFYTDDIDGGNLTGIVNTVSVYPDGAEAAAGPVRRVLIPCNNGSASGSNATLFAGGSVQNALAFNEDSYQIRLAVSTTEAGGCTMYFATNQYSQLLQGKRILGVNLLYSLYVDVEQIISDFPSDQYGGYTLYLRNGLGAPPIIYGGYSVFDAKVLAQGLTANTDVFQRPIYRCSLGRSNHVWNTPGINYSIPESLPWTYADLQRFEISSANRYELLFDSGPVSADGPSFTSTPSLLDYAALEIFYCEETRVAVGGLFKQDDQTTNGNFIIARGANTVTMRHPVTRAASPTLTTGLHTVTVTRTPATPFEESTNAMTYDMQGLRQLYAIPTLLGRRINVPFPADDPSAVGKVFTVEDTNFVPQITLHATDNSVYTASHAYGRQAQAQVYGTVTATQEIQGLPAAGVTNYDQVRFIARRFGETTVPLQISSSSLPGAYALIQPAAFDALPEIIDGWKEVTLTLAASAAMGASGVNPQWQWDATGEKSGNRWEILGAAASALSGVPGNLLQQVPSGRLERATYGAPLSGSPINLGWINGISPLVSGTTDDVAADAFLIFSKTPASVSGMVITQETQNLVSLSSFCSTTPSCVPQTLTYNKIAWTRISPAAFDTYSRVVAPGGWGTADSGQTWTVNNGGAPTEFAVNGTQGTMFAAGAGRRFMSLGNVGGPDQDVKFLFTPRNVGPSGVYTFGTVVRYTDTSNLYYSDVLVTFDNQRRMSLRLGRIVGGSESLISDSFDVPMTAGVDTPFWVRTRISGNTIYTKVWSDAYDEPAAWQLWQTDNAIPTGNSAGMTVATTFATPITGLFDNFTVSPPGFGAFELQRYDNVDGAWSTIMLGTNPATTGFNDYEARVGTPSVYRMRQHNVYDFVGAWNTPASGTITSPGVTNADIGVLIFTSNTSQSGAYNLAYTSSWENDPSESFVWPEGSAVALQEMYNKDFVTAFHPLERSGERFTRVILVNSVGVATAVDVNAFKSLRDMAWAELPYVCVRNELGERWYAAILVPGGTRRRMSSVNMLQLAETTVVQVTDTPAVVNPA
jgi:hypothetical protein